MIQKHELAYSIERIIERKLRSLKVPRAKSVAQDLMPDLMAEVPSEAFEPCEPWERGILFFHGRVSEKRVLEMQENIERAHLNLPKSRDLLLNLSSVGGEIYSGIALASTIQQIRRTGRRVNVHIQGTAQSMASLIMQAADHRTIEPNAWLMIHEIRHTLPSDGEKTSAFMDEAKFAERVEEQTWSFYTARTGKPYSYYHAKMHRRDWFLNAEEALAERLVDEIAPVPPYARRRRK